MAFELDDSPRTFDEVRDWLEPGEGRALHGARGCLDCLQTGYSGRTGVFEVLRITRELRPLIAAGRPTGELRDTGFAGPGSSTSAAPRCSRSHAGRPMPRKSSGRSRPKTWGSTTKGAGDPIRAVIGCQTPPVPVG